MRLIIKGGTFYDIRHINNKCEFLMTLVEHKLYKEMRIKRFYMTGKCFMEVKMRKCECMERK